MTGWLVNTVLDCAFLLLVLLCRVLDASVSPIVFSDQSKKH